MVEIPHRISVLLKEYYDAVDGRDKVSQKWSFKNEPPG